MASDGRLVPITRNQLFFLFLYCDSRYCGNDHYNAHDNQNNRPGRKSAVLESESAAGDVAAAGFGVAVAEEAV